jgi:ketosteroid isomerase-like protein
MAAGYLGQVGSGIEETVRRGLDAFNRRDREAWLEVVEPDVVNLPPHDWPEPAPVRGREAVWDFFIAGNEPWDAGAFELVELIEVPDDRAIVHIRAEMKGKASGAAVIWSFWMLVTLRDRRFARMEWYAEREDALAAAGLPADAS